MEITFDEDSKEDAVLVHQTLSAPSNEPNTNIQTNKIATQGHLMELITAQNDHKAMRALFESREDGRWKAMVELADEKITLSDFRSSEPPAFREAYVLPDENSGFTVTKSYKKVFALYKNLFWLISTFKKGGISVIKNPPPFLLPKTGR